MESCAKMMAMLNIFDAIQTDGWCDPRELDHSWWRDRCRLRQLHAPRREVQTIEEDVYEPYLIKIGFLERTPRGRVVTEHCLRHLGHPVPEEKQVSCFEK